MLRYGLPLVPASLSQFILHFSDRFFLTRYATESELGLYSLAYRFGMLVSVFYGIVSMAWGPWAFRVGSLEDGTYHLQRATTLILFGFALVASGIILFARPTIHLMSAPRFWGAADYVPPLAIAYWFFVAQGPLSVGARLSNRTDALAGANMLSALLCLLLSGWLIPLYGAWGAAGVTLVSLSALAATSYMMSRRYRNIGLSPVVVSASLVLMLLSAILDVLLRPVGWWQLAGRIGTGALLVGVLLWQGQRHYSLPSVIAFWYRGKDEGIVARILRGA
ncbi:MAG: hypothetical protein KatS3mg023_1216 [Armatimonadota bacterium]|nr:MAG: hypothetical protein KatS3mg023_1216 [Armatimonadota bacterium]